MQRWGVCGTVDPPLGDGYRYWWCSCYVQCTGQGRQQKVRSSVAGKSLFKMKDNTTVLHEVVGV